MTDLEIMKHAQKYMDQLANGIDPISGNAVPDDTVLNNVRLAKCFSYVSSVLQKVIDNGGYVLKPKKIDFIVTDSVKNALRPAEGAIRISEFLEMLKVAVNSPDIKVPGSTAFTDWLLSKGFMEKNTDEAGKSHRVPTDEGRRIGIYTEYTKGVRGEYLSVYYSIKAQQFLIDHMDEIFSDDN